MISLPRPRTGLRRHRVEDQVLVYDTRTDRTHLLDLTTGTVLDLLEEGARTPEALVAELGRRIGRPADEALATLATDELRKAELLDEGGAPAPLTDVTRRQLLHRAGLAGAAALLVPAIVSLSASPLYADTPTQCNAEPVGSKGVGCACTANTNCQSRCCQSNTNVCKSGTGNCKSA